MAEQSTYIKIDRNIMRWRWWHDHNTLIVFLVLLMRANIQDNDYDAINIKRGQVVCSYSTISQQANLSIQKVRTAFLHLKSTGEITSKAYRKYQVITITNYEKYQGGQQTKQQRSQQAINRQSTGKQQQYKNIKNEKNEKNIPPKSPTGGLAHPSDEPKRGTDEFRNKSHLLLNKDEGTVDDIPVRYREMCNNDFKVYWEYRNQ